MANAHRKLSTLDQRFHHTAERIRERKVSLIDDLKLSATIDSEAHRSTRVGSDAEKQHSGCEMAQWVGFGFGDTHEKRVKDAAEALRQAVEAFRQAVPENRRRKNAKAVRRLAERLMCARMGMLKARIAVAREAQMGGVLAERSEEMASCQNQMEVIRGGGLPAILAEFRAPDAAVIGTGDSLTMLSTPAFIRNANKMTNLEGIYHVVMVDHFQRISDG
jgi:hypothetical protein